MNLLRPDAQSSSGILNTPSKPRSRRTSKIGPQVTHEDLKKLQEQHGRQRDTQHAAQHGTQHVSEQGTQHPPQHGGHHGVQNSSDQSLQLPHHPRRTSKVGGHVTPTELKELREQHARQLQLKVKTEVVRRRRSSTWHILYADLISSGQLPPPKQPTYKIDPDSKIPLHKVSAVVDEVLEAELAGHRDYDAEVMSTLSMTLSDKIKDNVLQRVGVPKTCKVISLVYVMEKVRQDGRAVSRCLWNPEFDCQVTVVYEKNPSYVVSAIVYFAFID